MDAYVYRAALWCGPCVKKLLVASYASLHDLDLSPADTLERAKEIRGYKNESDYDSGDLPKGPYPNGGGEADTPQHCDGCGVFLGNPLTTDGERYVIEQLVEHARDGRGDAEVLNTWGSFYGFQVWRPGEATIEDLRREYALFFDHPDDAREWWFKVACELYVRGEALPDEWKYRPGLHPVDPDDIHAPFVASAGTETLRAFADELVAELRERKSEEE